MNTIRILLADDHAIVREGIRALRWGRRYLGKGVDELVAADYLDDRPYRSPQDSLSARERDKIMKKVMEDPRLADMMDPKKMPFDGKRMFWGGFKPFIEM